MKSRESARRTKDDLTVAFECNTEGWPDGPDAWATVLSRVWQFEMYCRRTQEDLDRRGRLLPLPRA